MFNTVFIITWILFRCEGGGGGGGGGGLYTHWTVLNLITIQPHMPWSEVM